MTFHLWFNAVGRLTTMERGTRQRFAACRACNAVTPIDPEPAPVPACPACTP